MFKGPDKVVPRLIGRLPDIFLLFCDSYGTKSYEITLNRAKREKRNYEQLQSAMAGIAPRILLYLFL